MVVVACEMGQGVIMIPSVVREIEGISFEIK